MATHQEAWRTQIYFNSLLDGPVITLSSQSVTRKGKERSQNFSVTSEQSPQHSQVGREVSSWEITLNYGRHVVLLANQMSPSIDTADSIQKTSLELELGVDAVTQGTWDTWVGCILSDHSLLPPPPPPPFLLPPFIPPPSISLSSLPLSSHSSLLKVGIRFVLEPLKGGNLLPNLSILGIKWEQTFIEMSNWE